MIRCIIIDDEPLAVSLLEQYATRLSDIEIIGGFTDPLLGLKAIRKYAPDMVFLDIQMPELSGMDVARTIAKETAIIFTTAYKEYAVEGFELNAVDYLMKPISFSRFVEAVTRVQQSISPKRASQPQGADALFIKHEHDYVQIPYHDIDFIKGQGDYAEIHTEQKRWMTLKRLKDLETILPDYLFCRVHKSYIVHIKKIERVSKNRIYLKDHVIPISGSYLELFKQTYLDHL